MIQYDKLNITLQALKGLVIDMIEFLAHISSDGRKQSVLEHLHGTAIKAAEFASAFGAEEQGRLAGMAHDIGKYSAAFQRRIQGAAEQVDHATAESP